MQNVGADTVSQFIAKPSSNKLLSQPVFFVIRTIGGLLSEYLRPGRLWPRRKQKENDMKTMTAAAVLSLALAGCGAPAPYRATGAPKTPLDQALAECDYEASKATAGIVNGLEAGFMQGTIRHKCMAAKGFTR
jgi:predicted small lipoprotein YifL